MKTSENNNKSVLIPLKHNFELRCQRLDRKGIFRFVMKTVLFKSHYFSKKLTCLAWAQRFEKSF